MTGQQVIIAHPRPDQQPCRQALCGQAADSLALFCAHRRDANLKLWHPQLIQALGNGDALFQGKGHPGGLFAIAQGGVVYDDMWCGHDFKSQGKDCMSSCKAQANQ